VKFSIPARHRLDSHSSPALWPVSSNRRRLYRLLGNENFSGPASTFRRDIAGLQRHVGHEARETPGTTVDSGALAGSRTGEYLPSR
jgi:hypothetical protein